MAVGAYLAAESTSQAKQWTAERPLVAESGAPTASEDAVEPFLESKSTWQAKQLTAERPLVADSGAPTASEDYAFQSILTNTTFTLITVAIYHSA